MRIVETRGYQTMLLVSHPMTIKSLQQITTVVSFFLLLAISQHFIGHAFQLINWYSIIPVAPQKQHFGYDGFFWIEHQASGLDFKISEQQLASC